MPVPQVRHILVLFLIHWLPPHLLFCVDYKVIINDNEQDKEQDLISCMRDLKKMPRLLSVPKFFHDWFLPNTH